MSTDWEARYQSGDMPWEKGAPSPGLVEFIENNPPIKGDVLVVGCGYGHDVRAISTAANRVLGLDLAPSAIKGAGEFPRVANESYRLGDLLELPADLQGAFDWMWEHTCFCAINPSKRRPYVESAAAALRPGGQFLAIFYMTPRDPDEGPPFGTTKAELDGLFGEKFELLREWLPSKAYDGREGRELMRLYRRRG
jgi:SAM-dependent methyltransferase